MDFLKSMGHPEEVMALLRFKFGSCDIIKSKCDFETMSDSLKFCYDMLTKTSRSFALVILALEGDLRDAICIFYLVLRALDTVEDDMTIPIEEKVPILKSFYKNLEDPDWRYMNSKEKDKIVLEKFQCISQEYRSLDKGYRDIISEACAKMGEGMTVFLEKKVDTLDEWDEYCYYVAGLVGIGLTQLFSASNLEDKIVGEDKSLANRVGLLLQKTNIIRDYLEDWNDGRNFWPKAVWIRYADDLGDFAKPENSEKAVECLNDLITNALELIPSTMLLLSRLRNQSIFNFVAIPQIMAVATLERCYNNPKVFTGVVKIRKGEAVRMMMSTSSLEKVKAVARHFVLEIQQRIPDNDPNAEKTKAVCLKALEATKTEDEYSVSSIYPPLSVSMGLMLSAIAYTYWSQLGQWKIVRKTVMPRGGKPLAPLLSILDSEDSK